jgi:flavin reductase (DIM6/NTAB) family NADH-FMN oxidoreductase RutF
MTANSLLCSLEPLLVPLRHHNALIVLSVSSKKRFGVNILRDSQQPPRNILRSLQGEATTERLLFNFSGPTAVSRCLKTPWLTSRNVIAEHPAGDHTLFLAEVESMDAGEGDYFTTGDTVVGALMELTNARFSVQVRTAEREAGGVAQSLR